MSIRHPPENRVPPVARKKGDKSRRPRIVKYEQQPVSFFRRWTNRLVPPPDLHARHVHTTVTRRVLG